MFEAKLELLLKLLWPNLGIIRFRLLCCGKLELSVHRQFITSAARNIQLIPIRSRTLTEMIEV